MKNNYNPWRVSTFTLLLLLSVAVGFSGKIQHFDLSKSVTGAITFVGILVLVQLPELIMTYLRKGRNQ
ncbi:hypothetical protein JQC73_03230 [Enterococcus durans]|uniref:hypothetical protein n=1 Tax=Enterococcus durans TaxID=53345 RepID=UPI00193B8616|nr:hypothetical protein [Enterococcus durans]MBM1151957.1 hypothetical protein [Enterococcus durans]